MVAISGCIQVERSGDGINAGEGHKRRKTAYALMKVFVANPHHVTIPSEDRLTNLAELGGITLADAVKFHINVLAETRLFPIFDAIISYPVHTNGTTHFLIGGLADLSVDKPGSAGNCVCVGVGCEQRGQDNNKLLHVFLLMLGLKTRRQAHASDGFHVAKVHLDVPKADLLHLCPNIFRFFTHTRFGFDPVWL